MKIEVITSDAYRRLSDLSIGASCIRAVMAYWTIPAGDLPAPFVQGLRDAKGFLCVDIHNPTSIDALTSLKKAGVDVCLHLVSTTGKSEIEDSTGMPNHLMHSKVVVFDYDGRDSVVWVGSHNGTFRALEGINFECTLAVETSQSSELYREVLAHLTEIRAACQPFRLDLIEHYRFLQRSKLENAVSVMEFENGNDQPLTLGEEITVFNMSKDDSRACKTVDAGVYVSVHGQEEILYSARVVQTGETPAVRDQSFSERRYADRYKNHLPVLLGSTTVTKDMYRKGTYFAMVKIEEKLDAAFHLLEIPTQSAWVNLPRNDTSRFARLEAEELKTLKISGLGVKGLKFKVPSFEEFQVDNLSAACDPSEVRVMAFKEVDLNEKRKIKRPSLIRKKLLVRR
jgi:hypothetical protein